MREKTARIWMKKLKENGWHNMILSRDKRQCIIEGFSPRPYAFLYCINTVAEAKQLLLRTPYAPISGSLPEY